jgi:Glycosyl hydrolase family 59
MRLKFFLFIAMFILTTMYTHAQDTIMVSKNYTGKTFDGICGINAGGAVGRLLINYPEPQRNQILDFLFKPNYGASLQGYKAEIGGDGNSTEGAEPSHMHTAGDENYNRGYQWWMMKEAKKRNPNIELHALAWDFPGWIKDPNSQAAADYLVNYVKGAKKIHNLTINYIGLWNETKGNIQFAKLLRKTLDANGFKNVKITADDQVRNWSIADTIMADKKLYNCIDIINTHYPKYESSATAKTAGKTMWCSEDGSWSDAWGVSGQQGGPLAKILNLNYVRGKITSTHIWCILSAYYDILDLPNAGQIRASTPWSGHYQVMSPVWVTAHTTQFAKPGWQYIDTACKELKKGGSIVTLKNGNDFSSIIETLDALETQTIVFKTGKEFNGRKIFIWHSDSATYFKKMNALTVQNGKFTVSLQKNSVYSITTTTGQAKGFTTAPTQKKFNLPYKDDFEKYAIGNTTPAYFVEQNGAYEIVNAGYGKKGKALRQVVSDSPVVWTYGHTASLLGTASIMGDKLWSNYSVSADVLLEEPGYARVMGRVSRVTLDGQINGYQLYLYDNGDWKLNYATTLAPLDSGKIDGGLQHWHNLQLAFADSIIVAFIDNKKVSMVIDARFTAGMAGIGNFYNKGLYDNFMLNPVPGKSLYAAATNNFFYQKIPETPPFHDAIPLKNAVKLSWDEVYGAKGYKVKMGTVPGKYEVVIDTGQLTSYTLWTLQSGQPYYFIVTAYNDIGESVSSYEVSAVAK